MKKLILSLILLAALVALNILASPIWAGSNTGRAAGFENLGHSDSWYSTYNRPRPRPNDQLFHYGSYPDSICTSCHGGGRTDAHGYYDNDGDWREY